MQALPEWVDREAWEAFIDMRKKIKKPATEYAQKLLLRNLFALRSAGQDANACIEQSIVHCWSGIFPLKPQPGAQPLTFRERDLQNERERNARLTGGLFPAAAPKAAEVIDMEPARARLAR